MQLSIACGYELLYKLVHSSDFANGNLMTSRMQLSIACCEQVMSHTQLSVACAHQLLYKFRFLWPARLSRPLHVVHRLWVALPIPLHVHRL